MVELRKVNFDEVSNSMGPVQAQNPGQSLYLNELTLDIHLDKGANQQHTN